MTTKKYALLFLLVAGGTGAAAFTSRQLQALADFLLRSGFQDPYMSGGEWDEHTLENLKNFTELGAGIAAPSVAPTIETGSQDIVSNVTLTFEIQ